MKIRILATLAFLLAAAPAAQAATTTNYDGGDKLLTLTNDADAETFAVTVTYEDPGFTYKVTAANAVIPLGTSTCANQDGGKTILCEVDDNINRLILDAGEGNDSISIGGTTYYSDNSNPGLVVRGEGGNDTFTAGAGGALLGGPLDGGPGDDTFVGSADFRDSFRAEPGNDTYIGGTKPIPAGQDPDGYQRYSAGDSWDPVGDEPISITLDGLANDGDGQGGTDNVSEVENIEGTKGNDTLIAGSDAVYFTGEAGDDALTGSPQGDSLGGGDGNDTLRGLAGDDYLYDGDRDEYYRYAGDDPAPVGNDTLDGGDGDDQLSVAGGKDDVVGGAGTDSFTTSRYQAQVFAAPPLPDDFAPTMAPVTVSLNDQPDDGITGSGEGDNIHADVENVSTGDSFGGKVARAFTTRGFGAPPVPAADTITGSAAANEIVTGGGNDKIDPGAGPDRVMAGTGDDMINAVDQATDTIVCGRGADTVGADLPGTNPGRADVLTDCETVTGTPLGLEGGTPTVLPTAPKVTVGGGSTMKVKKFLRSYKLTTQVTSDQPSTVAAELSIAGAKIAKTGDLTLGTSKLKSGTGTRKIKTKVSIRYRKALKRKLRTKKQRRKGIKLKLAVTVTNASGQATKKSRTVRVKG